MKSPDDPTATATAGNKSQPPVAPPPSKLDSFDAHIEKKFAEFSSKTGGDGGDGFCPDDFFNSFTTSKKEKEVTVEEQNADTPNPDELSDRTSNGNGNGAGQRVVGWNPDDLLESFAEEEETTTTQEEPATTGGGAAKRDSSSKDDRDGAQPPSPVPNASTAATTASSLQAESDNASCDAPVNASTAATASSSSSSGGGGRQPMDDFDARLRRKKMADSSNNAAEGPSASMTKSPAPANDYEARLRRKLDGSSSNAGRGGPPPPRSSDASALDDFDARVKRKSEFGGRSAGDNNKEHNEAGMPTTAFEAWERKIQAKCSRAEDVENSNNNNNNDREGRERSNSAGAGDRHRAGTTGVGHNGGQDVVDSRSALDAFEERIQKKCGDSPSDDGNNSQAQSGDSAENSSPYQASKPAPKTMEQRIQEKCARTPPAGEGGCGRRGGKDLDPDEQHYLDSRSALDAFEEKIQKKKKKASSSGGYAAGNSGANAQNIQADDEGAPNTSTSSSTSKTLERRIQEKCSPRASAAGGRGSNEATDRDGRSDAQSTLDAFEERIQKKASSGGAAGSIADASLGTRPTAGAASTQPASETLERRIQEKVGSPAAPKSSPDAHSTLDAFEDRIQKKKASAESVSRIIASAGETNELRPPVPVGMVHCLEDDDDDASKKKHASNAASGKNGGTAAAEIRPPVPFVPPQSSFGDEDADDKAAAYSKKASVVSFGGGDNAADRMDAYRKKASTVSFSRGTDTAETRKARRHASTEFEGDEEAAVCANIDPNAEVHWADSGGGAVADDRGNPRVLHHSGETPLIPEAFLVTSFGEDDNDWGGAEVVMAEPVRYSENKWRRLLICTVVLLFVTGVFLSMSLLVPWRERLAGDGEEEAAPASEGPEPEEYCSPCVDRARYTIKAIVSGEKSMEEKFAPAARRAALDAGVNLELEHYKGKGKDERMAVDIISAATNRSADALIVSVLSESVASAVRYAAERGVPVFGVEAGAEYAESMSSSMGSGGSMSSGNFMGSGSSMNSMSSGSSMSSGNSMGLGSSMNSMSSETSEGLIDDGSMLFFSGMNDQLGGKMAADYFLEEFSDKNYTGAVFISHAPPGTSSFTTKRQYKGYKERLVEASNGTIEVEWLKAKGSVPDFMRKMLSDCDKYQSVLVGTGRAFKAVEGALRENGCYGHGIRVGSFEPDNVPPQTMLDNRVHMVLDQHYALQGWTAVQNAALYVTTGQLVVPPPGGLHYAGPILLTNDNFTSIDELSRLSVCEEADVVMGSECIDRNSITIAGVVHGSAEDKFWDAVFAAAEQAAADTGVQLTFNRSEPRESDEGLYQEMAAKVLDLCAGGIDGLFVSLPDETVADAVRNCKESNPDIQIVSINAGYETSKELDLIHHVGMVEHDAGYQAGKEMANSTTLSNALCINHKPGFNDTEDRCKGFERAMNRTGIEYLGQIAMQGDDTDSSVSAVERAVGRSGDWDGYGMLLTGLPQLPVALELKRLHPGLVVASFDTDTSLYESLEAGDVLFGIDQQPYLQGYLPVSILTNAVATRQHFLGHLMSSGPRFVFAPPAEEETACEDRNYPVCSTEE